MTSRSGGRSETWGVALLNGPVEYLIVGFRGMQLASEITKELSDLVGAGTIRLLDVKCAVKAEDGSLVEVGDEHVEALSAQVSRIGFEGDLISPEDVGLTSLHLEPGTSALLLLWEDLWAMPLAEALRKANGIVIGVERVPREVIEFGSDAS